MATAPSRTLKLHDYTVVSSDLNDYSYGHCGIDFLMERKRFADSIVINPHSNYQPVYRPCHRYRREGHAWLLRLAFLEGRSGTSSCSASAAQGDLCVSRRLTMWRGDEEARPVDGTTAYAWFVWHEGYTANPEVFWV